MSGITYVTYYFEINSKEFTFDLPKYGACIEEAYRYVESRFPKAEIKFIKSETYTARLLSWEESY